MILQVWAVWDHQNNKTSLETWTLYLPRTPNDPAVLIGKGLDLEGWVPSKIEVVRWVLGIYTITLGFQTPGFWRYLDPKNIPSKHQTSGGMTGRLGLFIPVEPESHPPLPPSQYPGGSNSDVVWAAQWGIGGQVRRGASFFVGIFGGWASRTDVSVVRITPHLSHL